VRTSISSSSPSTTTKSWCRPRRRPAASATSPRRSCRRISLSPSTRRAPDAATCRGCADAASHMAVARSNKAVEALLIEAHEAERMRIARELHDDIGQRMAVLTMDLDTLGQALPLSADEASSRLRLVSDRTLAIARDIQALSHRLYPARLEYLG